MASVSMGMNLWFPHMGNFWTSYRPISFSRTLLCGYCVGCVREVKELLMILTITLLHAKVDAGLKAGTPRYVTVVLAHNAVSATATTSVRVLICNRERSNCSCKGLVTCYGRPDQTD